MFARALCSAVLSVAVPSPSERSESEVCTAVSLSCKRVSVAGYWVRDAGQTRHEHSRSLWRAWLCSRCSRDASGDGVAQRLHCGEFVEQEGSWSSQDRSWSVWCGQRRPLNEGFK